MRRNRLPEMTKACLADGIDRFAVTPGVLIAPCQIIFVIRIEPAVFRPACSLRLFQ